MHDEILRRLRAIEKNEGVRVLFAVEAGSRAWGLGGEQNTYDVRFVYTRPMSHYLRLDETPTALTYPADHIYLAGRDISRVLRKVYVADPTLSEWIRSPILYMAGPEFPQLRHAAESYFSPVAAAQYYYRLAQKACAAPPQPQAYLYALRAVLACRWVAEHNAAAPVVLAELMRWESDPSLRRIVDYLMDYRGAPEEFAPIPQLEDYLAGSLSDLQPCLSAIEEPRRPSWDALNELFAKIIRR